MKSIHEMNIAFVTEGQYFGEIPENHPNMRTDLAWQYLLKSTHFPIQLVYQAENIESGHILRTKHWDWMIIIIPKNVTYQGLTSLTKSLELLKGENVGKIAIMQEGPNWYWQDYPVEVQIVYLNLIRNKHIVDLLLCHNIVDKRYYQGIVNDTIPVFRMPSQIVEFDISKPAERKGIMIGGNMVSWYGGADSYLAVAELGAVTYCVSMGRKQPNEEAYNLIYIPYMNFRDWMHTLNLVKFGIHLMRTYAAGTFFLNCAYLGIPAIGYDSIDTARSLHPNLNVATGDVGMARETAKLLLTDKVFYEEQSQLAMEAYRTTYSNAEFIKYMDYIFSNV